MGWLAAVAGEILLIRWQSGPDSPPLEVGLGVAIDGAATVLLALALAA